MHSTETMAAAFKSATEQAGSMERMAVICKCTKQNIWSLIDRKRPAPPNGVLAIEADLGVSRHALRPDIFGDA